MKTPQDLNPLDAFREFAQNWHRFKCAAPESGEFRLVLAARIRALCAPRLRGPNRKDRLSDFLGSLCGALEANPAFTDHFGDDLPGEEFMARFAQELAQWPCGSTEFSPTPASRRRYPPESIKTKVQELDIAGACRPLQDLLDGYFQWLAPSFGDVAFVIGEGTNTSDPGLGVNSLIQHYFRITGGGQLLKPKRIASDLNDLIFDSRDRQTVSCFYAHYTATTRVLEYFNAGHRSPLVLQRNPNRVIRLNKGGPPLGSSQERPYGKGTVQLRTGDRIIAFNRGVAESWATPH